MFVLFVCFGPAAVGGGIAWWVANGWRAADPGAPRLDPDAVGATIRRHVAVARWLRSHLDPTAATGSLLVTVGAVTVVGGGCIGILLAMVRTHQGFARFDASAARFGAAHATALSTHVLRLITQIGGAAVLIPVALLAGAGEARRSRSWTPVAFLSVVFGGQLALAELIKAAVHRVRPDVLRLTGFAGTSFPSGHATAAAATFAAFALLLGRGRRRSLRCALVGVSVGLAVLVAASRVTLGVHWLTDVLAGLTLGWMWFAVTSLAFGGRRLRFGDPLHHADLPTGAKREKRLRRASDLHPCGHPPEALATLLDARRS